jgi:hypothetical protein
MAEGRHLRGGRPLSPLVARITALAFLAIGIFEISFAIQSFAQGGY